MGVATEDGNSSLVGWVVIKLRGSKGNRVKITRAEHASNLRYRQGYENFRKLEGNY